MRLWAIEQTLAVSRFMKDQIPELSGTKSHFQNNSSTRNGYESEAFEIWDVQLLRLKFLLQKNPPQRVLVEDIGFQASEFRGVVELYTHIVVDRADGHGFLHQQILRAA